jgi:chemotaxis protein methyltransferase CheR
MASEGIYMAESLEQLPQSWRRAFFSSVGGENEQVVEWLRREVIFRKLNLMQKQFPFRKRFHIIWCRNVMIYFDAETRKQLVERFYSYTEPGGYLFIGHSESISRNDTMYKYIMPAIYRKDS